jgi:hypothetical protein
MISVPTCTIGGDGGSSFTWPVCELAFEKSSAELVVSADYVVRPPARCHDGQSPSCWAASAVPSIRDAILAKAVSREVEVSSANGEKPQSSQVPS